MERMKNASSSVDPRFALDNHATAVGDGSSAPSVGASPFRLRVSSQNALGPNGPRRELNRQKCAAILAPKRMYVILIHRPRTPQPFLSDRTEPDRAQKKCIVIFSVAFVRAQRFQVVSLYHAAPLSILLGSLRRH